MTLCVCPGRRYTPRSMQGGPLTNILKNYVDELVFARGLAYYEKGHVEDVALDEEGDIRGIVHGHVPYAVHLVLGGDVLYGNCECSEWDPAWECQHVVALAFGADGADDDGQAGFLGSVHEARNPRGLPTGARRESAPARMQTGWRGRLRELEDGAIQRREVASASKPDRIALFELWLDPDDCRRYGGLVLSLSRRLGRKHGGHGEAKEAKWSSLRSFRSMADDVRRALGRVANLGSDDAFGWRWNGRSKLLVPAREAGRVFEVLDGVVPVCVRHGEADGGGEPLNWGPEPWRFHLAVDVREEDGEQVVRLRGELLREKECEPLSAADLLLANGIGVLNGGVAPLDDAGAFDWITNLRAGGAIEVCGEEVAPFLANVINVSHGVPLELGSLAEPAGEPQATLDLALPSGQQAEAKVRFLYGDLPVSAANPSPYLIAGDGTGQILRRNREAEDRLLEVLAAAGCVRNGPEWVEYPYRMSKDGLASRCRRLLEGGWQVRLERKPLRTGGRLSVRVKSGIDWFDIQGEASFDQSALALPDILHAVAEGKGFVTLQDGEVALLPPEWIARLEALGALTKSRSDKDPLRIARARAPLLDLLLADLADVEADETFEGLRRTLRGFQSIRPRRERKTFRGELRDYQRDALGWFAFLREAGLGGCLADDMGLGKTVQVLACLLTRRRAKDRRGPSLVVAPRSVMSNWVREAKRFAPSLRCAVYHGPGRGAVLEDVSRFDLIVTTYGTLQRDIAALSEITFDYAILDESQAIKNAASKTARAARLLDAEHRLALSGTPIENHLDELGSLFAFLNPGLLGSKREFQRMLGSTGTPSPERLAWLQAALRPVILRRTREEVLTELPKKEEQTLVCPLLGEQRQAYDKIREHYRASVLGRVDEDGLGRSKMHVLEALLRLRQAACHPGLIDPARIGESAAKLDVLLPMLEEIAEAGHKALVFSQFTSFLAILRQRLDQRGIRYEYLDGKTRKRSEHIDRFQQDPSFSAFLISLKAGGTGLNLTAAQYVFLLDPWWNPAVEAQAVGRAHRMGQENPVSVYRLIGQDTVEDRVLELQARKRDLVQAVLGGVSDAPLRGITRDDLELLLG